MSYPPHSTLFSAQISFICFFIVKYFPHIDLKSACYWAWGYNATFKITICVVFSFLHLHLKHVYSLKTHMGANWLFRKFLANSPSKEFSFVCILVAIFKISRFGLWHYNCSACLTEVVCFIIQWALPVCGCDTPVEGSQEPIVGILGKM